MTIEMNSRRVGESGRRETRRWAEWLDDLEADEVANRESPELISEGGTLLLDLVAAVDYLGRGLRPNLTVWDAFEEALRWFTTEQAAVAHGAPIPDKDSLDPDDPDPLRTQLRRLVESVDDPERQQTDDSLQRAIRRWCVTMAAAYNTGHSWPHPASHREFPPTLI